MNERKVWYTLTGAVAGVIGAGLLAGCAVSTKATGEDFSQVKQGVPRQQVISSLGEPARTDLGNGAPSSDFYYCDHNGQIMMVKYSPGILFLEFVPTLGIASLVDMSRLNSLGKSTRACVVRYTPGGTVAATSVTTGSALSGERRSSDRTDGAQIVLDSIVRRAASLIRTAGGTLPSK